MSAFLFSSRAIGAVPVEVWLTEKYTSEIEITENAVESGAKITDHAYVKPKKVTVEIADANAAQTFADLVYKQEDREPFTLMAGLVMFDNMLIKNINVDRDAKTSKILRATIDLQEIVIVETQKTEGSTGKDGKPGGKKSTKASSPSKEKAKDATTKDKATAPTNRGDSPTKPVPAPENKSLLNRMIG